MDNHPLQDQILEVTRDLLNRAGFKGEVKLISGGLADKYPVITIESEQDLSMLIGKNGQNLNAFEHLIKLIVNRKTSGDEDQKRNVFVVDINDYRKTKAKYVLGLARSAAQKVISSRRAEALLPMSAYERRLVHTELATYKELQTESIGEEPHRRIVIKPLTLE